MLAVRCRQVLQCTEPFMPGVCACGWADWWAGPQAADCTEHASLPCCNKLQRHETAATQPVHCCWLLILHQRMLLRFGSSLQVGLTGLSPGIFAACGLRVEWTFLFPGTGTASSVLQLPGLLPTKQTETRGVFLTELSSRTAISGVWKGAAVCCVHRQPELLPGLSLQGGCLGPTVL